MSTLLIKNIGVLATSPDSSIKKGIHQKDILLMKDAYILCEDGRIRDYDSGVLPEADEVIDAKGKLVTPGLVDAHTHLIFGGWRQNELAMKLAGAGYLDILNAGGGILSTVKETRKASKEELYRKTKGFLDEMLRMGTTTCEAKSGYGLNLEDEVKQLEVIRELDEKHPMDLVATYLGAHAYPEEYINDHERYIKEICEKVIPYVADHKLAEFCDVFCETGVFSKEESERILLKGKEYGLKSKIHADEIDAIGGSLLAGEIGAVSAEHLIVCSDEGIAALSKGGVIACLLPATSFYLSADFARARKMIENDVPIAFGSDFNPGSCPCLNLQLVMNLGCLKYRMTPEEVLNAVTINAAAAIDRADRIGSIEAGKQADLVIWDAEDLNYLCYRMGSNLAHRVIKKGETVYLNEETD
ncbi:MAG: imidazolonepropionase [Erysipelotrichaceae bacterium]|nr:imidazolonepropionase [Erysipelotrichaceae bacterium]